MSEKILKFLLSELKTVRIVCRGHKVNGQTCGAVLELSLKQLSDAPLQCQLCGTKFHGVSGTGGMSPFVPLADAIEKMNAVSDRVELEFVLPAE